MLLAVGAGNAAADEKSPARLPSDTRALRLKAFFDKYGCPAPYYTQEYLHAADTNNLDYRLLPAISIRESTCGRHDQLNNRWGWGSAKIGFNSVVDGIHFIARRLVSASVYRGRTTHAKLEAYNPRPEYAVEVEHLMAEIENK